VEYPNKALIERLGGPELPVALFPNQGTF